ncbi:unnamed protein product, partial [Brassica oleracea var. botrytis]
GKQLEKSSSRTQRPLSAFRRSRNRRPSDSAVVTFQIELLRFRKVRRSDRNLGSCLLDRRWILLSVVKLPKKMVGSPNPKKSRKTIEKTFKNGGYHIKIDALKCLLAYADQFQDDDVASAMDDIVQRMKDTTSVLGAESVQRVIDMLSHQQRGDK